MRNPSGNWIRQRRKNFIRVIMAKSPDFIASYPKKEQELLLEFFDVLKNYDVDIVSSRDKFIKKVQTYLKKHEYSKIPFHWFVTIFLENALMYLSQSDLFGHPFYQYLARIFRGTEETPGLFELIKKQTPLEDTGWEKLQYLAIHLIKPLTLVELTTLNIISQATYNSDEKGLNTKYFLNVLAKTEYNTLKKFSKFSELLKLRWRIIFHLPAFDLEQITFKIQLTNDDVSIDRLLNLSDPKRSVLNTSTIYKDKNNNNTYIGIFVVPSYFINDLKEFLAKSHENNLINLIYFNKVIQTQVSLSFDRYEAQKGWRELTKSERQELQTRLKIPNPRRPKTPLKFYLTEQSNLDWNYSQEQDKNSIITKFCQLLKIFRYTDLPILSKSEKEILKVLYQNKVAHNAFYSIRLWDEYSFDEYWIEIPKKTSFNKVARILAYLPVTAIFTTEKSRYLWTRLRNDDISLLKTLKINIDHIIPRETPVEMTTAFYDKKTQKWISPKLSIMK
ncbi:MAG: hypothetical protein ACTSPV_07215 [Candidatus Hodarchaeales archaeon]